MRRIRGDDLVQCGICRVLEDPCLFGPPFKVKHHRQSRSVVCHRGASSAAMRGRVFEAASTAPLAQRRR